MPALHVLSTKWHSLLPALIPHSVIRAHLLQSLFSVDSFSARCHCRNTVLEPLPPQAHTHTHTTTTALVRPHVSSKSLWKLSTCLRTVRQASLIVCEERRHLSSIKPSLWPWTHPWVLAYQVYEIQGSVLSAALFPQCHYYATSVWMSSCRAMLHSLAGTHLLCEYTHATQQIEWLHWCLLQHWGHIERGYLCIIYGLEQKNVVLVVACMPHAIMKRGWLAYA